MSDTPSTDPIVLATAQGPDGETLELWRVKDGLAIAANGRVIIHSAHRRSERELINVGMVPLRDRQDITVLLAG